MNRNRSIKILLGCAHFNCNSHQLDHFACCITNYVTAQNFLRCLTDNKFHEHFFAAARKGVAHRFK